jgi:hypothetical protein
MMFEPSDTKQYKTIMAKISSLALYFLPTQQVRPPLTIYQKKSGLCRSKSASATLAKTAALQYIELKEARNQFKIPNK